MSENIPFDADLARKIAAGFPTVEQVMERVRWLSGVLRKEQARMRAELTAWLRDRADAPEDDGGK